jgi:DME family drug/metabolite transporter
MVVDPQSVALPHGEPWRVMTLVAYLALGPTVLAYVIYCAGMARCRSASAGLVASMIEPGLAALLGWAILGENLSVFQALGCALVTAAMFTLWGAERRTPAD